MANERYKPEAEAFLLPEEEKTRAQYDQRASAAEQRQAPTAEAATVGPAASIKSNLGQQYNQGLGAQLMNLQQLQQTASGQGPSVAEAQMKAGLGQALAGQRSAAASATGSNRALAQRMASQNMGQMQADISGQAGMARANEALQARQMMGNVALGMTGQDIGMATGQAGLSQQAMLTQAGFQQQTNLANQQANLQQQQISDAMVQNMMAQGLTLDQAVMQAQIEQQKQRQQGEMFGQQLASQEQQASANRKAQIVGGVLSAGGQAGAAAIGKPA